MPATSSRGRRLVRSIGVLAATAPLALLAACGSSTASTTTTTSPGSTKVGSGGSSGLKAAEAATATNEKPAVSLGVTTPLTSKAPAGKTFIWLQCEIPQCATIATGVKAATQAVGWKYRCSTTSRPTPPRCSRR